MFCTSLGMFSLSILNEGLKSLRLDLKSTSMRTTQRKRTAEAVLAEAIRSEAVAAGTAVDAPDSPLDEDDQDEEGDGENSSLLAHRRRRRRRRRWRERAGGGRDALTWAEAGRSWWKQNFDHE